LTAKPSHGSHPDARAIAQSAGLPAVELKSIEPSVLM